MDHRPTTQRKDGMLVGLTDDAAIAQVRDGESQALELLYDRYSPAVFALARRIVRDETAAEEIVQETFWRVWQQASRFEAGKGRLVTWILSICHHLAIDSLRRSARRPRLNEEALSGETLAAVPSPEPAALEVAWVTERRILIRSALGLLPAPQREAVELAYFGGMTQMEIATVQSAPVSTVKTRLALGLKKLAEALAANGVQVEDALS